MKTENENNDPVDGQCTKDSDCASGYVCVNGKCVPDIAPTKKEGEADS